MVQKHAHTPKAWRIRCAVLRLAPFVDTGPASYVVNQRKYECIELLMTTIVSC